MNPLTIETERLVLRKVKQTDAPAIFRNWANDPEVTKYMTWNPHEDISITNRIVDYWLEEEKKPEVVRFIITVKGSDEPLGMIDVVGYRNNNVPEIGYCLSKKAWGKGYMTEACTAFVQHLFSLGHRKIVIAADVNNIGSNRVIEKCGFQFLFRERLEHRSPFKEEPAVINWYELRKNAASVVE